MNPELDVVRLTRELVDIPSTTGQEKQVAEHVADTLERLGWTVTRQPVAEERFNVLALRGRPDILLTTHLDTVPPYFPSSEDDAFVHGRGACDAKGIAAAMICAGQELAALGERDAGLLFVVGEEVDSAGAKKAAESGLRCRYFIDGEPTDNELALGHKGIFAFRLTAAGRCCHSGYPEQGDSAIDKLLEALQALRAADFPSDPELGPSYLNIGTIGGGRAPNVLADQAEAVVMIRTVTDGEVYRRIVERTLAGRAHLDVFNRSEPQRTHVLDGHATKVVAFGTDVPWLRPIGEPVLIGPGSILVAHTEKERIAKRDLRQAVAIYREMASSLLHR